jgi:hypothetical protein
LTARAEQAIANGAFVHLPVVVHVFLNTMRPMGSSSAQAPGGLDVFRILDHPHAASHPVDEMDPDEWFGCHSSA